MPNLASVNYLETAPRQVFFAWKIAFRQAAQQSFSDKENKYFCYNIRQIVQSVLFICLSDFMFNSCKEFRGIQHQKPYVAYRDTIPAMQNSINFAIRLTHSKIPAFKIVTVSAIFAGASNQYSRSNGISSVSITALNHA